MTNGESARTVVSALRELGRVEQIDEGLLTAYVSLADELDDDTKDRAGLFREFRAYDVMVRNLGGGDDDGDSFAALISELSSEMGHRQAPRPSDQG